MASVVFDYAGFSAAFPELLGEVSAVAAQQYFNMACLYLDNSDCSIIADASVGGQRSTLLNLLTAHIAALRAKGRDGAVGRITAASQGSVSISLAADYPAGSAQWYTSTSYGAMYWEATAQFRQAFYIPACNGPAQGYGFGQWGNGPWQP
jgi:hypothetical protein